MQVTRYTRAGRAGKLIRAPCGHICRVYHFAWSALRCGSKKFPAWATNPGCGRVHEKCEYEVIA